MGGTKYDDNITFLSVRNLNLLWGSMYLFTFSFHKLQLKWFDGKMIIADAGIGVY